MPPAMTIKDRLGWWFHPSTGTGSSKVNDMHRIGQLRSTFTRPWRHDHNGKGNSNHQSTTIAAVPTSQYHNPAASVSESLDTTAMAGQPYTMATLAATISSETAKVEAYFQKSGLALPDFHVDSTVDLEGLPKDIANSRRTVIMATRELSSLMVGPKENVRWLAWDFMNTQSLVILEHFGIAKLVPADGAISLAVLQAKTTLDPINLARLLRHAMVNHIFCEPTPGRIAHTAASRLLAEDVELGAWVGMNGEFAKAAAHSLEALVAFPEATGVTRSGFNFANGTVDKEPMFVTLGKDPSKAKRMGLAMSSLTGGEGYEVSYLVDQDIFSDVDARGGTLVDMGGSHGFVSVDLARRYRRMRFVVQDLPRTIASAPSPATKDMQIAQRITFEAHDFFTEQTCQGADVYFFRWIMHNHSKPYAVQILKNLIPALKEGARIVINDHCLRDPGAESPWDERLMRSMDLVMLSLLNAQEREEWEFKELFALAGEGFKFKGVTRPEGCRMSIIEAVWEP